MDNFWVAYENAIKGKQHYREVREIAKSPETFLKQLLQEVRDGTYKVSEYTIFKRFTGGKEREIYKLPMRDRIVQHAIMVYLEPIFRETFILDTYSSIKTRGIHLGLKRVKRALKDKDYKYCLKLDIRKCYPSLDQSILKEKLARKIRDKRLLSLLYKIIESCDRGVPIGNYTSQYFNNFYFSDFDHWLKEKKGVKHYFRYCDDMVILGKTKEELHQLLGEIRQYMSALHVELKPNCQIFPIDIRGIDFLGYVSYRDHVAVRKHTKRNFSCKVSGMCMKYLEDRDINVLGSYWGILVHGDCRHLWRVCTGYPDCDAIIRQKKKSESNDKLYKRLGIMRWYLGHSENFEQLVPIGSNATEVRFCVRHINPMPTDMEEHPADITYLRGIIHGNVNTVAIRQQLENLVQEYDNSVYVNQFRIGNRKAWLDKATRVGLVNSLNVKKATGADTIELWLGKQKLTVPITAAEQFLQNLELYAMQCYNTTAQHLAEIKAISDRKQLMEYDITKDYPEPLTLNI